ncbi:DEAD/DEAH box helicase [Paenibacillus cremeus]|uniref:DEAD/DEAH box helicase n=1 Tax=Paenibacillus cremeus TaxID=2163881 RepID=A0A559KDL8_9BACL|nr:DEAD/DEAH box helicase [Paenibacillus cremeus]TVY10232.1 DEAD/DEAH box helicase [Paenibacillus cremeus]
MKKNDFVQLGVSEPIAEAMSQLGITEPTPIQKQAIPAVFAGNDMIAQAQTGTGKTLAFVLPILESIDPSREHVQALIVTPTRELAIQITDEVKRLAPIKGLRVLSCYGGQDVERQIRKLEGNVHIIVATPGRLLDHMRRETVQLHKLAVLVLDEADQMLHMGFLPEVEQIISVTPSRRQTLLFSATMPPKIRDLAKAYMKPAVEIEVKAKRVTLDEIEQVVLKTSDRGKLDALCKSIDEEAPYLAMIFCRTKLRASKLNNELLERGYACDELHGDLTQAKREQVMKRFRDAKIQFLVATDIAARGLDVEGITHVFNYDIPHDAESYIHRIGRTGRAGQTGKAITFAAPRDAYYLELIEKGIKASLTTRSAKASDREVEIAGETVRGGRGRGGEGRGTGRGRSAGRSSGAERGRGGERSSGAERGRSGERSSGAERGRGGERSSGGERSFGAERGRGGERSSGAERGRGGERSSGAERGRGGERSSGAERVRGGERSFGAERGRGGERSSGAERARGGERSFGAERGRGRGGERSSGAERARGGERSFGAERGRGGERSFGAERGRGGERSSGVERGRGGERSFGAERGRGGERSSGAERGGGGERSSGAERARGGERSSGAERGRGGDEWFNSAPSKRGVTAARGQSAGARAGRGGDAGRGGAKSGGAGARNSGKSSGPRGRGR